MKRTIAIAITILFLSACATMALAEIKEGLWEMKTTMEMKGIPTQIPPTTTRTCISKSSMVPKPPAQGKQEQDCKIRDQKISGDTVTYVMACTGQGGMTTEISGSMTYRGDSMEGTTNMKVSGPASMEMSSKISGKYIGPCAK